MGVKKIEGKIQTNFFWPGLHDDVTSFCRSCDVCLLDHLYTNAIKGEIDVGVLQVNLTDHFPLVANIKDSTPVKIEHDRIKLERVVMLIVNNL